MLGKSPMRLMILYLRINQDVLDMVPPSAMTGDKENRRQEDLCICSEDSDLPGDLQSWAVECYCGERIYGLGWEQERDRMVMSWAQRHIWRGETGKEKAEVGWLDCQAGPWWWLGLVCCQGPCSGVMAMLYPWSLLMSLAPDSTKGQADKAIQSRPHPSLVATLGRTCSTPHQLKCLEEQLLHLAWTAQ